jgi:membrane protease YdiL (CAAX protease family)
MVSVRYSPSGIDLALLVVMIVLMAIEVVVFGVLFPATARGTPRGSRFPSYSYLIVYQWAMTASIAALWVATGRPWSALLLGVPKRWGFGASLALSVAFLVLSALQRRALFKHPEIPESIRRQILEIEPMAPHTPQERRVWTFVAITAGCCEEVMFRGFLLALFASWVGLIAAVAINVAAFGVFHAYYGWKGILKTGAFGLVMALLALWSASLIPVIILHAGIDLNSGDLAYRVRSK